MEVEKKKDNENIIKEYYQLIDPKDRKELLENEEAFKEDEAYQIRKELFELRYQPAENLKDVDYVDRFLQLWLELHYEAGKTRRYDRHEKAYKHLSKFLDDMGLSAFRNKGETERKLLYEEMRHFVKTYIHTCQIDKAYSKYLDFIPVPKGRLREKIRSDISKHFVLFPEAIGLYELIPEMSEAAKYELNNFAEA